MISDKTTGYTITPGVINRDDLTRLLYDALSSGNLHFIQAASKEWLNEYSNDITFQCFLARSSFQNEDQETNIELLKGICKRDPENSWALELILKNNFYINEIENKYFRTALFSLGKEIPDNGIEDWGIRLKEIRRKISENEDFALNEYFGKLIGDDCPASLMGIYHLIYLKKQNNDAEILSNYAKQYHQKWPECIAISLYLADSHMKLGKETKAVSLLHDCAVMDPGGEIITRHFGSQSEYMPMWPSEMAIQLTIPVPSQIAIPLNLKQLPSGINQKAESSQDLKKPDKSILRKFGHLRKEKIKIHDEFVHDQKEKNYKPDEQDLEEIIQKNILPRELKDDQKKPVYVVLSIKNKLIAKYGEKSSSVIIAEIKKLADSASLNFGWQSVVFFPDDLNCMRLYNLDPLVEINPWKIKLALVDLDKYLSTKKQMISGVLIVGGTDIVPFHALPNPTDDKDKEVLSDNPYSTLDVNYFVPEWPVGRLPDEATNDPGLLLKQIRQITQANQMNYHLSNWWIGVKDLLRILGHPFELIHHLMNKPVNYGYSASIWRRSSLAAFRPIGNGNHLRVTPPFDSSNLDIELLKKSKYAYFNLHGLADSAEWYGQKDISEDKQGPDFPTAITAKQLMKSGSVPSIVFSEACYGAFVEKKTSDDSIALKFKDAGNSVFIGSTCIAYGSINTPLTGADLLAFIFWKFVQDGQSAGEAFMQAKVSFAKLMMQRQGYLDGEDQKILLSFVYYGDPSAKFTQKNNSVKSFSRNVDLFKIKAISDHDETETIGNRISGEILTKIKNDLKIYLPGIDSAEIRIHQDQPEKDSGPIEFGKMSSSVHSSTGHTKISYYRPAINQNNRHFQYARVTVDNDGKMVKLVMSR